MQKIFFVICQLISSFALERGNIVRLIGKEEVKASTECKDAWVLIRKGTVEKDCVKKINCTYFYLHYKNVVVTELFGTVLIDSKINKFELRVLSDNIERKIDGAPSTLRESTSFLEINETFNFSVNQQYQNLSLGIWGPDFCGTVSSMSLYYYECPTNTPALVDFDQRPAPSKFLGVKKLTGNCTDHAVKNIKSSDLSMKCYYNGTFEVFGKCECDIGFSNYIKGQYSRKCLG